MPNHTRKRDLTPHTQYHKRSTVHYCTILLLHMKSIHSHPKARKDNTNTIDQTINNTRLHHFTIAFDIHPFTLKGEKRQRKHNRKTHTTAYSKLKYWRRNTLLRWETKRDSSKRNTHASRSKCLTLPRIEIALHTQQRQAIQFYSTKLNRFPP